ncbi:MAG: ATP-binding cassette domain-containing protein, partial [Candidatus Hodarchaeales archaeon]
IFEDLSISFRRGELVALLGANGAGKTTLLRLLNGLLRPQKGAILLNGEPLPKKVSEAAQSVGIAFQNPIHQFFASTVQEELEYAKRWRKSNRSTATESIQQVAAQFNLEPLFDRSPHTLSSGASLLWELNSLHWMNRLWDRIPKDEKCLLGCLKN